MTRSRCTLICLVVLFWPVSLRAAPPEEVATDVLIYGATPAGIAAALAAADDGCRVVLVEPTQRVGGMTTHGLSHSDFRSFEGLSGPFLRFSQRVLDHYRAQYGDASPQVRDSWRGTHGEPKVNLLVFQTMLDERPAIAVHLGQRLTGVDVEAQRIRRVRFGQLHVRPGVAVDATYEGDLMAAAGVQYRVGREAESEYGEPLAPAEGDGQVQGYNFRLCMTQDPANRVPVPVPADYDRNAYAAIVPLVQSGQIEAAFGYPGTPFLLKAHLPPLPNGKHDINDVSRGLVRLSMPGHNAAYPEAEEQTRREIEQEHLDWQLGLIHFAQTDASLPEPFRREAARWGLCRDEFTDSGHLPPQIYVREARRMVGQYVYTQHDTRQASEDVRSMRHEGSIALGDYSHNCHGTEHEGPLIGGRHTGEFYQAVPPYQIPYGVLVPRRMENLLVPVACSASHVGFCALRLEPIWMSLGGAAGHAAAQAVHRQIRVQQVDVSRLQRRLHAAGSATIYVSDVPPDHPDFAAVQWWGLRGGLHGLEPPLDKPGARGAHIVSQYYEAYPGHAAQLEKPLDRKLAEQWRRIARQLQIAESALPAAGSTITRGQWIRAAFAASNQFSAVPASP